MSSEKFKPITAQEEIFVAAYVEQFSVSDAAEAAGITTPTGYAWLKDPRIKAEIYDAKHKILLRSNVSADQTIERLDKIIRADPTAAIEACLTCRSHSDLATAITNLPEEIRFTIKSFEIGRNGPKITFHDKMKALELMGRYFKLFVDKFELSGPNGNPIEMIDPNITPERAQEMYADMIKGGKA